MSKTKAGSPNWFLRLSVVAVVLVAIGLGVAYTLRPVAQVSAATRGEAVKAVPGTVEVKAEFAIELKSEVGGRIILNELDIGKRVFKNDVLVQIDTGDVDLEIDRVKSEIVAAKRKMELGSTLRAEVLNKQDIVTNMERQVKAGAVPQAELDQQKRLLQQLQQKMELDEVALKLALETNNNLLQSKLREKAKMTLVAPSDGVVIGVVARVGDLIDKNAAIGTIMATGRTVEAKLSEENFAAVKVGLKATVRFLTYGEDHYNAVVTKILPSADPTTQRYIAYLDVHLPPERSLVPGITGEVFIIVAQRANAILIPTRALVGDYVFVADGGVLTKRKVVKGYGSANLVEITSGLTVGDEVVVEQQDLFHDGERVRTKVVSD